MRIESFLRAGAALASLACASHALAQTEGDADEIVVTGQRAQQERAIEIKRAAIGIIEVVAADEIGRLPDRNVAEVIERLPGIGVTYDQGEGRYVAIRGVPSELNGYTVNGIEIGNPDGIDRRLPLDILSGQLLNRVEVAKVKTADQDGQGIGGEINLVTQTAFDFADRFSISANAQAGTQELNDKTPIRGDVTIGGRFGSDEQFGLVLGASYSDRTFTSNGLFPDDWRPFAGAARGGIPINTKYTDYSLHRERIGAAGSFDWRPNDEHSLFVRGIYSKFTEDEYRQRYRLDFATPAITDAAAARAARGLAPGFVLNPDGFTGTVTPTAAVAAGPGGPAIAVIAPERRQDLRQEYKEKSILAGMIGGSDRFGAVKLDWIVARVHNEVREPNQLWQFRCNPGIVDFDFSDVLYTAVPRSECTGTQMQFRQYTEQFETGDEDIWQGRADLSYDLDNIGIGSFVKFGGKYRTTDKSFDAGNDTWTRGATAATRFSLDQFGLQGPPVTVFPRDDRPYLNAPTIDLDAIGSFTAANLAGPFFVRDVATTLANETLGDFFVEEDVAAAYVMANLNFGAITVTPGLRYERTDLKITGFQLERQTAVVSAFAENSYDDWLPSLIVRIAPSRDTVFRLAYTRNLGRPNYTQLSPGGSVSYEDGVLPGTFNGSVSLGNPDLKPYRAHNFDASAEWYFAKGGLLSIGVFAKIIDNPIFTQSFTQMNVDFGGRRYTTLNFSQPLNADKGDIVGIEAAFQQQFTFLPGLLSGFGIEINGTLTSSTLRLPTGRSSAFPQQSRYLYGAQLFYQKGPLEASVAYHNTGKSLLATGMLDFQDQYNNDLRRLDAKASVELVEGVRVFAEAQNLTDEPTRQYQAGRTDWITQTERYGRTYYAGVSANF